jgi:hypothetical protein
MYLLCISPAWACRVEFQSRDQDFAVETPQTRERVEPAENNNGVQRSVERIAKSRVLPSFASMCAGNLHLCCGQISAQRSRTPQLLFVE